MVLNPVIIMENSDTKYKILSIVLTIAILATVAFLIVPNFLPKPPERIIEKIDFSNSTWIEQYMERSIDFFGKDFYVGTAFSYNVRSNKMIATYASLNSVEEAREHYLSIHGAELTGRNDEISLNVTAKIDGQDLRVYNYYSSISRVFELELTFNESRADIVIDQLEKAFPADTVIQIKGIEELVAGEIFGGYVRYDYDQFDGFSHPNVPIFSRAYFFDGSQADFDNIIDALNDKYPENRYEESQRASYYRINGQIVSITYLETDFNESIVTLSLQQEPN